MAAKDVGVYCEIGERTTYDTYVLFPNTHCLDRNFIYGQLLEYTERMKTDPTAEKTAVNFFESCLKGEGDLHYNYPGSQQKGLLPPGFSSEDFNIAVFSSSEHEFAVDLDWANPLFETQAVGIKYLAENIPRDRKIHIYLRIHPSLRGLNSSQEKRLLALSGTPHVTVIPADSPIQSYALLGACDNTVTFGSTIGIEAVFWGKPSILAGNAFYAPLDACYKPKTREEFLALCFSKLEPKPRELALPYPYWYITRNRPFEFISPQNPKKGNAPTFHGQNIMGIPKWLSRLNHLFFRIGKFIELRRIA